MSIGKLKAQRDHPRWPFEPAGRGMTYRHRHLRAGMGTAHPTFDDVGRGEWFQHLPYGRELALAPHHAYRIILAYLLAGDERQSLGG